MKDIKASFARILRSNGFRKDKEASNRYDCMDYYYNEEKNMWAGIKAGSTRRFNEHTERYIIYNSYTIFMGDNKPSTNFVFAPVIFVLHTAFSEKAGVCNNYYLGIDFSYSLYDEKFRKIVDQYIEKCVYISNTGVEYKEET